MKDPETTCPSCGATRLERFCPACGERRIEPGDFGTRRFLGQVFGALTSADSRLWRTLRDLLLHPGSLTAARLRGMRVGRLGPVQVFLLANVIVLLLAPWLGARSLLTSTGPLDEAFVQDLLRGQWEARGMSEQDYMAAYRPEAVRLVARLTLLA